MQQLIRYFKYTKRPIYPLVTFRVIFGLLMLISTARFMHLGWIDDHFVSTKFQFKYFGFEWVELLPPIWIYGLHVVMLLSAFTFMVGFFYRLSAFMLFASFTYLQLIDLTYYLNHYYFVSLILLLMCFIPAHKYFSVDVALFRNLRSEKTKAWHIDLIKFQIFCVYFFAGIAKMNHTWLMEAMPLKIWLPAHDKVPVLGVIFSHEWVPYIFSWGGMFYDTFIVMFLLFGSTRKYAYFVVIIFHIVVGILFQIGVFPVVMIGVTLIFFSSEWHFSLLSSLKKKLPQISSSQNWEVFIPKISDKIQGVFVMLFICFQLLFPLRYLCYPGNLFWTEEGYRFSWRVMLMEKAGTATFYVKNGITGRVGVVDNSEFLNAHQEKQMAFQPDMIVQFAHFLGEHYKERGVQKPEVRVEAWVTLNAAPSQLLIDPDVDLMKVSDDWEPKNWVVPFRKEK